MCGNVLLFLLPCLRASRVSLAYSDEGLFDPKARVPGIKGVPGVWRPGPRPSSGLNRQELPYGQRLNAAGGEPKDYSSDMFGQPQNRGEGVGDLEMELAKVRMEKNLERSLMSSTLDQKWKDMRFSKGFQVYCDMEDTLFASGGGLSGLDQSYYQDEIYPGAFQFALELTKGPKGTPKPSRIVPMASDPEQLSSVLTLDNKTFRNITSREGAYNLIRLERLYDGKTGQPIVFVGDNGQEDMDMAERLAMELEGDGLQAAFIHDVRKGRGRRPRSAKIHMFNTYHEAAQKAFDLGLISLAAKRRVESAFLTSTIVQMCQNQGMFTNGRYPCLMAADRLEFTPKRKSTKRRSSMSSPFGDRDGAERSDKVVVDALSLEPFPPGFCLDFELEDAPIFMDCLQSEIEELYLDKYINAWQDPTRCNQIQAVLDSVYGPAIYPQEPEEPEKPDEREEPPKVRPRRRVDLS